MRELGLREAQSPGVALDQGPPRLQCMAPTGTRGQKQKDEDPGSTRHCYQGHGISHRPHRVTKRGPRASTDSEKGCFINLRSPLSLPVSSHAACRGGAWSDDSGGAGGLEGKPQGGGHGATEVGLGAWCGPWTRHCYVSVPGCWHTQIPSFMALGPKVGSQGAGRGPAPSPGREFSQLPPAFRALPVVCPTAVFSCSSHHPLCVPRFPLSSAPQLMGLGHLLKSWR